MITQLEVGVNASCSSMAFGLAMQQDADVIVISDLRDPEVVQMTLGAVRRVQGPGYDDGPNSVQASAG